MLRIVSKMRRLLRVARTLAAHDALLPSEYAARVPARLRVLARLAGGRGARNTRVPPGLRLASAIKLGQFLATRPDILGTEIARGLETLQDRLPPFPEAEARRIVEAELNRPLETVFLKFGPPVAAASIAQVHLAETNDDPSRRVAVKILRPGIEAEFARDFEAFRFAARTAERFSAEARRLRLRGLVEMLAQSVALELDLRMEAAAASELAQNTREDEDFRVPALDWSRTSARVFTSEWVDGVALRDTAALETAGYDPKRIAVKLLRASSTPTCIPEISSSTRTGASARSISASWEGSIRECAASWRRPWRDFLPAITRASPRCISISPSCRGPTMSTPSRKPCAPWASRSSA